MHFGTKNTQSLDLIWILDSSKLDNTKQGDNRASKEIVWNGTVLAHEVYIEDLTFIHP